MGYEEIQRLVQDQFGAHMNREMGHRRSCYEAQRPNDLVGIEEAFLFKRWSIVYEGDNPLPNIFENCKSSSDRLKALLARPSSRAIQAIPHRSMLHYFFVHRLQM